MISGNDSVRIIRMTSQHLPEVAELHHRILPSLSSRLGIEFLETLYGGLLNDPLSRGWIASSNQEVVGFFSATRNSFNLSRYISSRFSSSQRIRFGLKILRHPANLKDYLCQRIFLDRYYQKRLGSTHPTLLTMGILPRFQAKGIPQFFITQGDHFLRENSVQQYFLDTEKNNIAVNFLYRCLNFQVEHELMNYIIWRSPQQPLKLPEDLECMKSQK